MPARKQIMPFKNLTVLLDGFQEKRRTTRSLLFSVKYLFGEEKLPRIRIFFNLRTAKNLFYQSIKIDIDLSIDKWIKIGKSDLIHIDWIRQSVEIDDTLVSFIDLSWFLNFVWGTLSDCLKINRRLLKFCRRNIEHDWHDEHFKRNWQLVQRGVKDRYVDWLCCWNKNRRLRCKVANMTQSAAWENGVWKREILSKRPRR